MVLGDPVSGKEFFDRNKEKGILYSVLEDFEKGQKRNLAIIGLRKIGKTSLIKEFIRTTNKNKPKILCLDIYLPEQSIISFFRNCTGSILFELFRCLNKAPRTESITLEEGLKWIQHDFPRTALAISNFWEYHTKLKYNEAFDYLFSVFEVLRKETGNPVIVFLDEFQRLYEYARVIDSPIDKFRQRIMNQKEILYVISGSAVGMLNRLISSTSSPLYGHFSILPLRGFDFKDAYAFIVKKKGDDFPLGDENISFLYEITNGNPFYLDILVHNIKLHCKLNKCNVSNNVLEEVLSNEIFKTEGSLYSYFNSLIEQSLEKSGSKYYTEILKSIASGNLRPSQIAKSINLSLTSIPPYLKKLQELEIIRKLESNSKNSRVSEYEICDSLFELWLKQVYELRQDPLMKDINIKLKIFKNNISKIIGDYGAEIGKGNESRVRELFREFNNDYILGLQIPKFQSVEKKVIEGEEIDIFCKDAGDVWIAEVTKENINTTEVQRIKDKIDKIRAKENVAEVIVISIKEIERTAVELCRKYKFRVWTLEDVNILLKKKKLFRILI